MTQAPGPLPTPAPPPRPRSSNILLLVLLGLSVLWIAYNLRRGPIANDLPAPQVRRPTADVNAGDWQFVDLKGEPRTLASMRGKPVFLNIWATWCPPCVAEMPSIQSLASHPDLKGVEFACVSVEGTEGAARVRRFVEEQKLTAPVYLADGDPPPAFQTEGIPATYILDADGRIVSYEIGASKWDDPSVVEMLRDLATIAEASRNQPTPTP